MNDKAMKCQGGSSRAAGPGFSPSRSFRYNPTVV